MALCFAYLLLFFHCAVSDYLLDREAFIKKEETQISGYLTSPTAKEQSANAVIMHHKIQELNAGVLNPSGFNPARHFFQARGDIEASPVFKIIRAMPKGAALHSHDTNTISQEYLMNLTYRENVYGCEVNNELYLKFMGNQTQGAFCKNWTSLAVLRAKNPNYDSYIKSQFFFNVDDPHKAYPDINTIWKKMKVFFVKYGLFLGYRVIFQEQFYQSLLDLYNDNVRYYEFRHRLRDVYELNGTTYTPLEIAGLYEETARRFKADHPDFIGARLIYVKIRSQPYAPNDPDVQLIKELYRVYPNFFIGYDICGQEDFGKPLQHFVDFVRQVPSNIKRFFHAGETNWYGVTDLNVIDAVLLNTSRIGHGFALAKHPLVMKTIMQRKIAIEVCPISNQVLKLVEDLRNHPAVIYIAWGYPVVLSNDNPTFWGVSGLSYDFYATFVGMTGKNVDLRTLKSLALNSLEYSSLTDLEKVQAIEQFQKDWEAFLDVVIRGANSTKAVADEL